MKRNQSLDVLRGVAVLLVILCHCRLLRFAWIGVDLFFVLSGFLISGLLFGELQANGKISVGRFLFRRGMKIYPAYFAYLLVTSIFARQLRPLLWLQTAFVQNYYYSFSHPSSFPPPHDIWVHTWSLAVEEHFYLLLPFLLIILHWLGKLHWIPALSIVLVVACFLLRVSELRADGDVSWVIFRSHLRADALFAGVALGYLWNYHRSLFLSWSKKPLGAAAPVLLVPAVLLNPQFSQSSSPVFESLVLTANVIAFAILLLWAAPRTLGFGRIAEIGRFSYSIYVWHMLVADYRVAIWLVLLSAKAIGCCTGTWIDAHPATRVVITLLLVSGTIGAQIAGSISLGIGMAKVVEFPALKLRDRISALLLQRATRQLPLEAAATTETV